MENIGEIFPFSFHFIPLPFLNTPILCSKTYFLQISQIFKPQMLNLA